MISSLQPTRPKYPPPNPHPQLHPPPPPPAPSLRSTTSPLNQQPTRSLNTAGPLGTAAPRRPRTQIEALPPHAARPSSTSTSISIRHPSTPAMSAATPVFDASKRHPVFFTDRLRKPPAGVGAGQWVSPVAMGYVSNEGASVRRGISGDVKL